MINCTRIIQFDAAHRVKDHESKCRDLHGHRYVVEAAFTAKKPKDDKGLDSLGRVIDFGVIKEKLGGWVDQNLDHNVILWQKDQKLGEAISGVTRQGIYYLPYNPTAENIAYYLLNDICPKLFENEAVKCVHIRVYETPNCYADVSLN